MTDSSFIPFSPKRALLSVSDKSGLIEIASLLNQRGVELIATGNTAKLLTAHHLPVVEVSEYTGFPEILDGRVKTLHPHIYASILARGQSDAPLLKKLKLKPFDLIIVNLYPFEETICREESNFAEALENIDIGGPTMIRAAAKNHQQVLVIVSPKDYSLLEQYIKEKHIPSHWPFTLAKKAFAHTAAYDAAISNYLGTLDDQRQPSGFPEVLNYQFHKAYDLRYGENPHQQAVFYRNKNPHSGSLAQATLIQGKALSYNNLLDADAALRCAQDFDSYFSACVIVKHTNPCGIALNENQLEAYQRAFHCDPSSSYGGIIAFNQTLEPETVQKILDNQFVEVIVAPNIHPNAVEILKNKPNIRVLITGEKSLAPHFNFEIRHIDGGILVQEQDDLAESTSLYKTVTHKKPNSSELSDLLFAWTCVKHLKSNAIVFAQDLKTIGLGAGQTSRIMSTRIASWQGEKKGLNGHDHSAAVMASDAFIPFPDTIELAAQIGITAIIQTGGSVRDEEIITTANQLGIAMLFTGYRHFKH